MPAWVSTSLLHCQRTSHCIIYAIFKKYYSVIQIAFKTALGLFNFVKVKLCIPSSVHTDWQESEEPFLFGLVSLIQTHFEVYLGVLFLGVPSGYN